MLKEEIQKLLFGRIVCDSASTHIMENKHQGTLHIICLPHDTTIELLLYGTQFWQ